MDISLNIPERKDGKGCVAMSQNKYSERKGAVVESPSLEVFKSRVDRALRDMVYLRMVSVRLMVGLDDLQGLFQPR